MVYTEMREFLRKLEEEGQVVHVKREVSGGYEVAAVMWEVYERYGHHGPVVWFDKIAGCKMPLVINIFGDFRRYALLLGFEDWRAHKNFKPSKDKMLEVFADRSKWIDPAMVKTGPCKEKIMKGEEASLAPMPIFKLHPTDGGPYIMMPGVINKDPEYGQNLGMYRVMVCDDKTTRVVSNSAQDIGIYCARAKKRGQKEIDCAIALGFDPALLLASVGKMPMVGRDAEFKFVGGLMGKPVELVKCETIDIDVPASSEIVLEGKLRIDKPMPEGPFGEYTGYYGEGMLHPAFHLTCVTQREKPIYVGATSGNQYSEANVLCYPQPLAWHCELQRSVVGFRDLHCPTEGRMFVAVLQVKKRYPGWGKQAVMTALGSGFAMAMINTVIVVDEDIDIYDWKQVLFALSTRVDPELDVTITPGVAVNALNPAARARIESGSELGYTDFNLCSKLGIDATKKFATEANRKRPTPEVSAPDEATLKRVIERWSDYGISI